jgi:hypothetical protein
MPNLTFDFTWYRDLKGYHLVPAKVPKRRPGQSLLDFKPRDFQPARIVRNGGSLQSYRPLEAFNDLFRRFIEMDRSEGGVLKFVQAFGPLTHDGLRAKGDHVPALIRQAEDMLWPGTMALNKLNAWIVTEHNETRLKVSPACLLDALWLQLAQANTRSKECPQCGNRFLVGVTVGKRKDAEFCSTKCQVQSKSLKRSRHA